MLTVSSFEAKTHLPELLRKVSAGNHITITKHNVPIAIIVPVEKKKKMTIEETVKALKEFRKGNKLQGLSIREMIEEGRR